MDSDSTLQIQLSRIWHNKFVFFITMRRGQKEHAVWRGYHQIVSIFIATLYQHHFSTVGCDKHTVNALQDNGHPDSNVHGTNMGLTWVQSAPDGPHVGPMNLAIRECNGNHKMKGCYLCSWRDRLPNSFNSLWSSDDTLRHRSRSILLHNIIISYGLLHDGTKPLPELMLTDNQRGLVAFSWGQFHRKCPRYISLLWVWKLLIQHSSHISQGPLNALIQIAGSEFCWSC